MSLLVAITGWDPAPWVERFKTLFPERRVVSLDEPFDRREVHYVAAWKPPHGSLTGLPNLAAIFYLGAGVDHILSDPRLPEVPLTRVVDPDLTTRMSEYVVLHCLMHLRQLSRYQAQQSEKRWADDRSQPAARDVRVGILGCGVLGLDAARKLKLIGFDVAGWNRQPKPMGDIPLYCGDAQLNEFLARTDILVCLLPLTEATRSMLNKALFSKLARNGRFKGPILINAARGGLQVEADIVTCLDDGTLAAATLDVFETEPLPEESPLWTHPKVFITPHNASVSAPDSVAALVKRQIERFEAGEPLEYEVDIKAGY